MTDNKRPAAATVIGVINVFFAGAGINYILMIILLGTGLTYGQLSILSLYPMTLTVIPVLSLIAGIGIISDKKWAVLWNRIFAAATILLIILAYIITHFTGSFDIISTIQYFMASGWYPVIVLIIFSLKSVREFYAGESKTVGIK